MLTKTLLPDTLRAIQLVSGVDEIQHAYLAGGTALALQLGHRISVDLDFFIQQEIDENLLASSLSKIQEFEESKKAWRTLLGNVGKTKFSIFYYKYPLLEKTLLFEGVQLASLADIAAMKLQALEDRGTRRDFVDLYFISKKYTFEEVLGFYQEKYHVLEDHMYSIVRALDYFEDAEQEKQMPQMLIPLDWEEVKKYFRKEAKRLAEKKL